MRVNGNCNNKIMDLNVQKQVICFSLDIQYMYTSPPSYNKFVGKLAKTQKKTF